MLELSIVIALILLNGFFALSEMALMTSRKIRLKQMGEHSLGARKALAIPVDEFTRAMKLAGTPAARGVDGDILAP